MTQNRSRSLIGLALLILDSAEMLIRAGRGAWAMIERRGAAI